VLRALLLLAAGGWLLVLSAAHAQEVPGCGSLQNAFGPFDFRDPAARGEPLRLVEAGHFTKQVETLQQGQSTMYIIQDLDYTLRAFPNHHRALNSMARYALSGAKMWTNPDVQGAECYFERAVAFVPDDPVVRLLYGNYLMKRGKKDQARQQYEEGLKLDPKSVEINYNAGLFFLELGDLERAKELAKVAYDGGYPLPGLQNKIDAAEARAANRSKPSQSTPRK
jgi:tetratricopeptide (TPR) repeat protein